MSAWTASRACWSRIASAGRRRAARAYHAYVDNEEFTYSALPNSLTDTETNRTLGVDIWTPMNDEINNYIMGTVEWDSVESLLAELKEYGMDQITAEVNEGYDKVS